jgi:hypothetical protein
MRPLRWVSKSHAKLAAGLVAMGHQIGKSSIPKLLDALARISHRIGCIGALILRKSCCHHSFS